ncbi:hypothetical protein GXM_01130 [Nostoc sphaeroides CCNUC1]|uniref:Uncharacterized protein n=1 Tax=Nostoc sphaeroides CCNUC1 TaxID=2653204 RepID=A0A5P8VTF9_9NOSO|nr:hypothetical protein GXM_01130 [Nostoc sphaeroides CCNUC1]
MGKTFELLFISSPVLFSIFFYINRSKEPLAVAIWETEIY